MTVFRIDLVAPMAVGGMLTGRARAWLHSGADRDQVVACLKLALQALESGRSPDEIQRQIRGV